MLLIGVIILLITGLFLGLFDGAARLEEGNHGRSSKLSKQA